MGDVVIIVPVLRRPYRVGPLLEACAPAEGRVLFVASPEDRVEQMAVADAGGDMLVVDWPGGTPGDWARKINAGYRASEEPWVLCGADDIHPHPGWFKAAMTVAGDDVGVIGTNDMGNSRVLAGNHSTHPLVSRAYADERGTLNWLGPGKVKLGGPGHVVVECYAHNFVDDELVSTAKARRAWAFAPDSLVEHLHPNWSKGAHDEIYELGMSQWAADRTMHAKRKQLWMGRKVK